MNISTLTLNDLHVNEQASAFNQTIMNIMSNFVPNELITCDDRDPHWMNRYINPIVPINDFHKKFACRPTIWTIFLCLKNYKTSEFIPFTWLSKSILTKLAKDCVIH